MSSPLTTDLYQFTMAQAYQRSGKADDRAVFHLFFRRLPFSSGYAIAAGLELALELLDSFRFSREALDYLSALRGGSGERLFDSDFIRELGKLELDVEVDAIAEGSVVFGNEPLVRVRGRLWHAQLLETALLNCINFHTLIATKASRMVQAAAGGPVLEFGARRAQGDAALEAARAAYVGGVSGTSLVEAGLRYGIPVRGTHAHSWVMSFDDERDAFAAYAQTFPRECVLLVDTYDSLRGVHHAIDIGHKLRARGSKLSAIRLDSGDLAWLSIQARKLLDEAGLTDTQILVSNDLDEHIIESLIQQGARVDAWAVGTKLATAHDDPALGGVYKLAMVQPHGQGPWQPRIKLSEQAAKVSTPGVLQVRRFRTQTRFVADVIFDENQGVGSPCMMVDPLDSTRQRQLPPDMPYTDLLTPVFRHGKRIQPARELSEIRQFARTQVEQLDPTIRRLQNPHEYPVGLVEPLFGERMRLIKLARGLPA